MIKIMFVCTGNTCRSPMAEYILKHMVKQAEREDIKVTSAGLCVNQEDKINANAVSALKKLGITVRRFKPKQVDATLCRKQNAVICMTDKHKQAFVGFNNVYTINELSGCGEIEDPFGKSEQTYVACAEQISTACAVILDLLKEGSDEITEGNKQ